jgi:hypothetical protein
MSGIFLFPTFFGSITMGIKIGSNPIATANYLFIFNTKNQFIMSAIQNAEKRVSDYNTSDKKLTAHKAVLLGNAALKIEGYTLSNVYNRITKSDSAEVKDAMAHLFPKGNPTFKEFMQGASAKYPSKTTWSMWYALQVCKSISVVAQTEKKIAKQGGRIESTTETIAARKIAAEKKAAKEKDAADAAVKAVRAAKKAAAAEKKAAAAK